MTLVGLAAPRRLKNSFCVLGLANSTKNAIIGCIGVCGRLQPLSAKVPPTRVDV